MQEILIHTVGWGKHVDMYNKYTLPSLTDAEP